MDGIGPLIIVLLLGAIIWVMARPGTPRELRPNSSDRRRLEEAAARSRRRMRERAALTEARARSDKKMRMNGEPFGDVLRREVPAAARGLGPKDYDAAERANVNDLAASAFIDVEALKLEVRKLRDGAAADEKAREELWGEVKRLRALIAENDLVALSCMKDDPEVEEADDKS